MRHPNDPDSPPVSVPRSTFEASYSANGWVEAKSPAANAVVVNTPSSLVDAPTTSEED